MNWKSCLMKKIPRWNSPDSGLEKWEANIFES